VDITGLVKEKDKFDQKDLVKVDHYFFIENRCGESKNCENINVE
jgi:hypothetical protein